MPTPNSETGRGVLKIVKNRLLTFVPLGGGVGDRLVDLLGTIPGTSAADGKLFLYTAHEDIPEVNGETLWGVMNLDDRQEGDDGAYMHQGQLEVQLFGRPKGVAPKLGLMGDLIVQAMKSWVNRDGGYVRSLGSGLTRNTVTYNDPVDRELVQERIVIPISYLPIYTGKYST